MFCANCGKHIADDDVFCPYCGEPAAQGDDDELVGLVAAARTGNQDAISALYEKTSRQVYYTVKSMIKDEDTVFDILQDTYERAFKHLDSFQGDTKFLPWVRQIAANRARDWLKKKRPMLFTELNPGDGQDTPVEELFPDERIENLPDQVIDQQETKRLLREILDELPEDQRAAIGMRYYEEMSVKEIAAAMGVSESAVKSRLMYGRNKIEKRVLELEKQGTKLYGLSPLPFLLLLFRNQEAYAAEVPDRRILQAILASQPKGAVPAAGAAQGASTAGGAVSAEAAGTAAVGTGAAAADMGTVAVGTGAAPAGTGTAAVGTGTAPAGAGAAAVGTGAASTGTGTTAAGTGAAAGRLRALKTGLVIFSAMVAVGLGIFGVTRIAFGSADPQEASVIGDIIDRKEPIASGEPAPIDAEEPETPGEESQSEGETEGSEGEDSQPAEEAEEEASISYIFSDMPIAAYEVTGLGVGRFQSVNEGEIPVEGSADFYIDSPLVRLTPGENSFVIFCMQGDEAGTYSISTAAIHSPSGSSRWEAITYVCLYTVFKTIGDFSILERGTTNSEYTTYVYNEETYGGSFSSMVDPWMDWVKFAEIYHPDSPRNDAIYVIDVIAYSGADSGFDEIDNVLAVMINTFEELGATTVREIPVAEALERCNVVVSEGETD